MHQVCVECHEREAEKAGRANLGDCSSCHEALPTREKLVALRKDLPAVTSPADKQQLAARAVSLSLPALTATREAGPPARGARELRRA